MTRRLSKADRQAWEAYRRTADPLHGRGPSPEAPPPPAGPVAGPVARPVKLAPFAVGQAARARMPGHDLAPSVRDAVRGAPVAMDARAFHRLRAGKLRPEAKLDLHGMTLDRAHPALIDFVLGAHEAGRRLLLVVTGKGKVRDEGGPMPPRHGVLRHQVPQWLRMPPLGPRVLQVAQAHRSHGGLGAYYVYLRRMR